MSPMQSNWMKTTLGILVLAGTQGSQHLRFSEFSPEFGGLVQNLPIFHQNSGDFLEDDILRFLKSYATSKLDCWFKSYSLLKFNLQNYEKNV